jgi:adenine-specific DNA-methyltransferase
MWLDMVVQNISSIPDKYKKSLAYFALFQSCIIKRPYNLFHRKNLYVRTAEVQRTFGNKKTWDTPFHVHFENFITQANNAVFDNGQLNYAWNKNIFDIDYTQFDLVYIDPPYIAQNGSTVDYFAFYHFLEGLTMYDVWDQHIDYTSKHRKLIGNSNHWHDRHTILEDFDALFAQFNNSTLVISYRDDGIPAISDLINVLRKYKQNVMVHCMDYKYVLSSKQSKEVLIIAQ